MTQLLGRRKQPDVYPRGRCCGARPLAQYVGRSDVMGFGHLKIERKSDSNSEVLANAVFSTTPAGAESTIATPRFRI